jgi:hypothetical protein
MTLEEVLNSPEMLKLRENMRRIFEEGEKDLSIIVDPITDLDLTETPLTDSQPSGLTEAEKKGRRAKLCRRSSRGREASRW